MNRTRQRPSATPSYRTGEKGVNRVRVFADPRTGLLYFEHRANHRKARTALGHGDWARAKAQADELAAGLRRPDRSVPDAVTLAALFANYMREVTPTKGGPKQGHDRRAAKLLLEILGPARRADDLTTRDVARYVTERRRRGDLRVGTAHGRAVGNRVIAYDLKFLKAVLNWGVGMGWLDRNPIQAVELPQEPSPQRPVIAAPQYEALLAVSEQVDPLFRLALIVANETGHRIGAVRLLRWEDVKLDEQVVRWQAENDKIGYAHETWMTAPAVEALRLARRARFVVSEWVFPSPKDSSEPVSRHLVRRPPAASPTSANGSPTGAASRATRRPGSCSCGRAATRSGSPVPRTRPPGRAGSRASIGCSSGRNGKHRAPATAGWSSAASSLSPAFQALLTAGPLALSMAAPHRLTALLVLVLCLPGCARWRSETQPVPELLLRDHPSEIRVTRNDSSRIVLHDPALVGDSLAGFPKRPPKVTTPLPEARAGEEPRVMVPLSEVRRVETKHTDTAQTLLLFGGVAAILALAALIAVGISLRGGLL